MIQLSIMYWSILHTVLLHYKDQSVTATQELNSFLSRSQSNFENLLSA